MGTRLFFGIVGAIAALMAAGLLNSMFHSLNLSKRLSDQTSPVLIFRSDVSVRLAEAGAKTGDPQISLSWENYNDLDLHCVEPGGFEIFFKNRRSQSGGELDVDMNVQPESNRPVENIYYDPRTAPRGEYAVYVNHYHNHGGRDPTPYTVHITTGGRTTTYSGSISFGDPKKLVARFQAGSVAPFWSRFFGNFWLPLLIVMLWASAIGLLMGLLLTAAQRAWLKRGQDAITFRRVMVGAVGGLVLGAIAGAVGQTIFYGLQMFLPFIPVWLARGLGFGAFGGLLGYGLGHFVPHLPYSPARMAGMVGSLLGAAGFLWAIHNAGDAAGRLIAAGLTGFCIGLMIYLAAAYEEQEEEDQNRMEDRIAVSTLGTVSGYKLRPAGRITGREK
jgi:hypothetical protein